MADVAGTALRFFGRVAQVAVQVRVQAAAKHRAPLRRGRQRQALLVALERGIEQLARIPEALRREPRRAAVRAQAFERVPQGRVGERAPGELLAARLELLGTQHPLHQPSHRAADPRLQ